VKVAMISYNTFVGGEQNGWKSRGENRILLLQNVNGNAWGMSQHVVGSRSQAEEKWGTEAKAVIDPLWEQLQSELPTIDMVVLYVGGHGAERIIELAAKYGLVPDRATFVFCDCNLAKKMKMVREGGFSSSRIVPCECGGRGTMERLYRYALKGNLPA